MSKQEIKANNKRNEQTNKMKKGKSRVCIKRGGRKGGSRVRKVGPKKPKG
jgi:hypothetical protein